MGLAQAAPEIAPTAQLVALVETEGAIRQVAVDHNQTKVVINKAVYVIPPELLVRLGPSLKVGAEIKISGTPLIDGTIQAVNVVVLNAAPAEHEDEKKDREHDD